MMEENSGVESLKSSRKYKVNFKVKGVYWREVFELETDKLHTEKRVWVAVSYEKNPGTGGSKADRT